MPCSFGELGNLGNSSFSRLLILNNILPLFILIILFFSSIISISPSGNSFTILVKCLAGMVIMPSFITLHLTVYFIPISKSVANIVILFFLVSIKIFDKIGNVVFGVIAPIII